MVAPERHGREGEIQAAGRPGIRAGRERHVRSRDPRAVGVAVQDDRHAVVDRCHGLLGGSGEDDGSLNRTVQIVLEQRSASRGGMPTTLPSWWFT